MPEYLKEDTSFYYCPKSNITDIQAFEDFIPLSALLEDSTVTNAYFNVIGVLYNKFVIVVPDSHINNQGQN